MKADISETESSSILKDRIHFGYSSPLFKLNRGERIVGYFTQLKFSELRLKELDLDGNQEMLSLLRNQSEIIIKNSIIQPNSKDANGGIDISDLISGPIKHKLCMRIKTKRETRIDMIKSVCSSTFDNHDEDNVTKQSVLDMNLMSQLTEK
jgi:hypothetical protein